MKVTKAIIATAGYSTRFLPICKTIPKCMLPIGNVPIIHEIVRECIDGGIKDIIIVTSEGGGLVENYFDENVDLNTFLKGRNQSGRNDRFEEVFGKANISFIRQNKDKPYGNAIPTLLAKPFLKENEAFALFFADDLVMCKSAIGEARIKFESLSGTDVNLGGIIMGQEVELDDVIKYGIVEFRDNKRIVNKIIEKPNINEAPSRFAVYGRYIATYKLFNYLERLGTGKNGELWLADAFDCACKELNFYFMEASGKWVTTGDPDSYFKANNLYMRKII